MKMGVGETKPGSAASAVGSAQSFQTGSSPWPALLSAPGGSAVYGQRGTTIALSTVDPNPGQ